MSLRCGIVGLPNVGKSTLFNALVRQNLAEAANYPFATIHPNIGRIPLEDNRLNKLAQLSHSERIIPATAEFVDIAGLVKGASHGEGMGNQFLAHIREVQAICHVVRCFQDKRIVHVENELHPLDDIHTVEVELLLADLASVEKRLPPLEKKVKGGEKGAKKHMELLQKVHGMLDAGHWLYPEICDPFLQLLSTKPIFYALNVEEDCLAGNTLSQEVATWAGKQGRPSFPISAKLEAELAQLPPEDRRSYLQSLGLSTSGRRTLLQTSMSLLKQITFFTTGPKETRAWTIPEQTLAPDAAGVIHSDFTKHFIVAEVTPYEDVLESGGLTEAKAKGKTHLRGKKDPIHDGDVVLFRTSA